MEFLIDLSNLRGTCASCANELNKDNDDVERYLLYKNNAAIRFGQKSLPICYRCWIDRAFSCDRCAIPINLDLCNHVGDMLLKNTTLVEESSQYMICQYCAHYDGPKKFKCTNKDCDNMWSRLVVSPPVMLMCGGSAKFCPECKSQNFIID